MQTLQLQSVKKILTKHVKLSLKKKVGAYSKHRIEFIAHGAQIQQKQVPLGSGSAQGPTQEGCRKVELSRNLSPQIPLLADYATRELRSYKQSSCGDKRSNKSSYNSQTLKLDKNSIIRQEFQGTNLPQHTHSPKHYKNAIRWKRAILQVLLSYSRNTSSTQARVLPYT